MTKLPKLKKYADLFRRQLQRFLSPGVDVATVIHPVVQNGAVFEFLLNRTSVATREPVEKVAPTRNTIADVLAEVPNNMIGGDLRGVRFGGTNISLAGNRILIIKGEDSPEQWTGPAVAADVERVVSTSLGGSSA
jgi:hypothetical protein